MELVAIEQRRDHASMIRIPAPRELLSGQLLWVRTWEADDEGQRGIDPTLSHHDRVYGAKLRSPAWTSQGWSESGRDLILVRTAATSR